MEYITVGEVLKAQGIAGELKVKPLTASPERFKKLRVFYIDGRPLRITGLRLDRDYAYVKLQGIDDRNAAELMRGKFLQIDRVNAIELDDGEYFVADLIGCNVVSDDGNVLGVITDIFQNGGAVDVINAKWINGKEFRFPFLNRLVASVSVTEKKFVVKKILLDEVCVYDD